MSDTEIARYLDQIERAVVALRAKLQEGEHPETRWARQMLSVLSEVEEAGGWVTRDELLEIGERYGYNRRGMAGFYQQLLASEDQGARLTDVGHQRLQTLLRKYEKLAPVTSAVS